MLKRVFEVESDNETFLVKYDRDLGAVIEGYDTEAQSAADSLSGQIGMGQFLGVLGMLAHEKNEFEFESLIKEWRRIAKSITNYGYTSYSIKSPLHIAWKVAVNNKMHFSAASNRHAHKITLLALALHKDDKVRKQVAKNPSTPGNALVRLLSDSVEGVRRAALKNPNMPQDILVRESTKDLNKRKGVASNPNTPMEVLWVLSKDTSPIVRALVASNPSVDSDCLAFLLRDSNVNVVSTALLNTNTKDSDKIAYAKESIIPESLHYLISAFPLEAQLIYLEKLKQESDNMGIPTPFARGLARDSVYPQVHQVLIALQNSEINSYLVRNQRLIKEIQNSFLDNGDNATFDVPSSVLLGLANNPALDKEIAKKILKLSNHDVKISLSRNPHISPEIIDALFAWNVPRIIRSLVEFQFLEYERLLELSQDPQLLTVMLYGHQKLSEPQKYEKLSLEVFETNAKAREALARYTNFKTVINKLVNLKEKNIDKELLSNGNLTSKVRDLIQQRYNQNVYEIEKRGV